jgi:ATP-dependent Clp protease adapter protein ClpS
MSQNRSRRPIGTPQPFRRASGQDFDIPRYKLMLRADAIVDLMQVVRVIMDVTRYCLTEAMHKMWQAHHFGQSLLFVTYRERAELFVELFADRGLAVTLEPA